jgi:hypothetical protein
MGAGLLAAIIVGSLLVIGGLVVGLLYFIFGAVRRAGDREVAALQSEGIVLDSGPVHIRFGFRGFRGPMVAIGVGVRAGPGRLVLTRQRLTFVPSGRNRFGFARMDREGLRRFQVGIQDGKLHLHSDEPPNATGTVDVLVSVANPAQWVDALTEASKES